MSEDVPLPWLRALLRDRSELQQEDFLAALLLNAGFETADLSEPLMALMTRFAARAGVTEGAPSKINRQIAEYFEMNPLPPDLVKAFETQFRSDLLARDPSALRAAVSQMGQELGLRKSTEPAPEGSHPGGALGFFAARAAFDEG